jgi:hypothetical protein
MTGTSPERDPELVRLAGELGARLPSELPDPGVRLGPYELRLRLGRGGAGTVWEAWDRRLLRRVAVKVLHPHLGLSEGQLERFRREARLATAVDHPGLCRVHDIGEDHGLHYLVEELVDGGRTLASRIGELRRGGDPGDLSRWAARLFRDVARAVAAVHAAGIAHRDLKPGNILLTRDGRPLVCDFGLAAVLHEDELGVTTLQRGTAHYLAPEQVEGRPLAGHRGDVFSLGVSLYETLALRRPFEGDTSTVVGHRILHEDPEPPRRRRPGVARDLETIVLRCLEKDPARRYTDAGELADDLDRFLEREPVLARRPGPLRIAARRVRRNPVRAVLATGSVALLGLVGTFTGETARLNALAEDEGRALASSLEVMRGMVDYMAPERVRERGALDPEFLTRLEEGARAGYDDDPLELARTLRVIAGFQDDLGRPVRALHLQQEALALMDELGAPEDEQVALLLEVVQVLQRESQMREALELLEPRLEALDPGAQPVLHARLLLRALVQQLRLGDGAAHADLLERHGPLEERLAAARAALERPGPDALEAELDLEQWELFHHAYAGRWEALDDRVEASHARHVAFHGEGDAHTVEMGVLLFTWWKVRIARGLEPDVAAVHARQEALTRTMLEAVRSTHGPATATGLRALRLRAECLHETRGPLEAVHSYDELARAYAERIGPAAPRTLGVNCALAVMLIQCDPDRAFAIMEETIAQGEAGKAPEVLIDATHVRARMQAAERSGRPAAWLEGFLDLAGRVPTALSRQSAWFDVLRESPEQLLRARAAAERAPGVDGGIRMDPELARRCEEAWQSAICDHLAESELSAPPLARLVRDRNLTLARIAWREGRRSTALERLEQARLAADWLVPEERRTPAAREARAWLLEEGVPPGRAGELLRGFAGAGASLQEAVDQLAGRPENPERRGALRDLVVTAAWELRHGERVAALDALRAVPAADLAARHDVWDCGYEVQRPTPCRDCVLALAAHRLLEDAEVRALPGWRAHLEAVHGEHPGGCPPALAPRLPGPAPGVAGPDAAGPDHGGLVPSDPDAGPSRD